MRIIQREIVSALIFSRDNKLFQGKKNPKDQGVYSDCWHIPGGGVEAGEDKITALIREIKEETGIDISSYPIELIDDQGNGESETLWKPTNEKVLCKMHFNVYRVIVNDKNADEIPVSLEDDLAEYRWFELTELPLVKLTPPSIALFTRLGYFPTSTRDTTQLPGSDELKSIMEFEAKRDVLPEKIYTHYPRFETFIALLDQLQIESFIIKNNIPAEGWLTQGYQEKCDKLMENITNKLLKVNTKAIRQLLNELYDYLSEEDELKKADAIFTFGGKTLWRVEKAIQLYQEGWSEKLVFSGHGSYTGRGEIPEAENYREIASRAGVPNEDIMLETESITTPDNVRRSLNLFDKIGFKPNSLILVNSPQPQRRGWCLFKKYLPDSTELIRQNCQTAEKYDRNDWFTNPEGIKVVLNEYIKMKIAVTLNTS